jgi:phage terminase large subunit-like protein
MPGSKTGSSTPRLSEYARAFTFPTGITKTVWTRVEAKGRELGLGFDWWQSQFGTVCLGYDANGKYVATVGGIGMSIPRQVGKTYFVLAMLLILCILFPGLQVVWTAHHLRTSTKTFTTLRGLCRRKKIAPHIRAMRAANGEQQVEFVNGSMIMFGARSQGFGRGFDEIDVEVFDEAQILDTKALEDMIAATNQARNPHGALVFFMGTPPREKDPSEAFETRRNKALKGKSPKAIWLEIGADPKSDPNDQSQWPLMNPSFPKRTPPESLERLREMLNDDDSWNREGRGIWDEDTEGTGAIDVAAWKTHAGKLVAPVGAVVLAVDTSLDRKLTALLAVGGGADGIAQVRVVRSAAGSMWAPPLVVRVCREHPEVEAIVIDDKKSTEPLAKAIADALEEAGLSVEIVRTSYSDMAEACSDTYDLIHEGTLRHAEDPELEAAVRSAVKNELEGSFTWSRRKAGSAIVPLVGMSIGLWEWARRSAGSYDPLDSVL